MNYIKKERFSISAFDRDSNEAFIRVAVSNVVVNINGELLGILSKSTALDGSPNMLGLIGGGAHLGEFRKSKKRYVFKEEYIAEKDSALKQEQEKLSKKGAFDFEGYDARFKTLQKNLKKFVGLYSGNVHFPYEQSIYRELKEELGWEKIHDQQEIILKKEELREIKEHYLGRFFHYEKDDKGEVIAGTNFRIINVFSLECSDAILDKIKQSPVIYPITQEMLSTGYVTETIALKSFIKPTLAFTNSLQTPEPK